MTSTNIGKHKKSSESSVIIIPYQTKNQNINVIKDIMDISVMDFYVKLFYKDPLEVCSDSSNFYE